MPGLFLSKKLDDMIRDEYLCPYLFNGVSETFDSSKLTMTAGDYTAASLKSLRFDVEKIQAQVLDAESRLKDRKKCAWICIDTEHANLIKKNLEDACIIHSKLSKKEQEENLHRFEEGSAKHIISVAMISEGYDFPAIDAVILMRPTRSPNLYVQAVGRGLRLFPGKKNCLILDYGEVSKFLGSPNDPLIREPGQRRNMEPQTKECPECASPVFLASMTCPNCGHKFKPPKKDKNLTAHSGGIEFNFGTQIHECKSVEILKKDHVSKSGNKCWVIIYNGKYRQYILENSYFHRAFIDEKDRITHFETEIHQRFGVQFKRYICD